MYLAHVIASCRCYSKWSVKAEYLPLLWHINYTEWVIWSTRVPSWLSVNRDDSDLCRRRWSGSSFDRAATNSTVPDLDLPNMYTYRLDCSLEGFICIFIRKRRRQQIFCGASRESITKSLSPCIAVMEQNIYFVFIPFLNCFLMCKSELQFQQGEHGCNPKYNRRRVDWELESHLFFFSLIFKKLIKFQAPTYHAIVCPTYWMRLQEFCGTDQVKLLAICTYLFIHLVLIDQISYFIFPADRFSVCAFLVWANQFLVSFSDLDEAALHHLHTSEP